MGSCQRELTIYTMESRARRSVVIDAIWAEQLIEDEIIGKERSEEESGSKSNVCVSSDSVGSE